MQKVLSIIACVMVCASVFAQPVPEYVHIDFSHLPDGTPTTEGMLISDQFAPYGVWFSMDDGDDFPIIVQEGDPIVGFIGNDDGHDSPMPLGSTFGLTDPLGAQDDFAAFRSIRIDLGLLQPQVLRLRTTRIEDSDGVNSGPVFDIFDGNSELPANGFVCTFRNSKWVQRPGPNANQDDVSPANYLITRPNNSGQPNGYALFNLEILRGPQAQAAGPYIRVSQESTPGADDFEEHILGYLRPRRSPLGHRPTVSEFYRYDLSAAPASFNGIYNALSLSKERSQLGFIEAAEGLTLIVIHNKPRVCSNGGTGGPAGHAEMQIEFTGLVGSVSDRVGIEDDPSNGPDDKYLFPDAAKLHTDHTWNIDHTDGFAITDLDGVWSATLSFGEIDGDELTLPFEGLTSWVATTTDGPPISLELEADRRVQLMPVCLADTNSNCRVDLEDSVPFTTCINGPGQSLLKGCEPFDIDPDHDVDLRDFARFDRAFNGF